MLSARRFFHKSCLFLPQKLLFRQFIRLRFREKHTPIEKYRWLFLKKKHRVLPKKPSSSGNVCIRYLHLVVRRERAHDLHSKAKRLRISCKKNFNFSELSFTVLSRELSAHAWCLFSCRPLQVTVKYYLNVIYIRV